jgi:hypothetical protein
LLVLIDKLLILLSIIELSYNFILLIDKSLILLSFTHKSYNLLVLIALSIILFSVTELVFKLSAEILAHKVLSPSLSVINTVFPTPGAKSVGTIVFGTILSEVIEFAANLLLVIELFA